MMSETEFSNLCVSFFDAHANHSKTISLKDKKSESRYILENDMKLAICKLEIDGKIIVSKETRKCDYGVLVNNASDNYCILIELKGSHIEDAFEQIYSTLCNNDFKVKCKPFGFTYKAKIVCSKVNAKKFGTSKYKIYRSKLLKEFNILLRNSDIRSKELKEKISNIIGSAN